MHLQAVLLCVQRPEYARHCNFAVLVLLVGMQSQSLRTSRNRDGCALLRSAERAFCKNAKPASARYRTTGLGCAQQALARQGSLYIQRHCLQESFVVPEWYHEALFAEAIVPVRIVNSDHNCYTGLIKNFSGGCYSDCTDNANREPTLPHLRRSSCRIPTAPNDRRT